MKKQKHKQSMIDDDIDILPEELEDDTPLDVPTVDDDLEAETTEEITEDEFLKFREDQPSDWE